MGSPAAASLLIPAQPPLSPASSSSSSPLSLTFNAHLAHTGSSLDLVLPADLPIPSLFIRLHQAFHILPSDQLVITTDGLLLLPASTLSAYASSSSSVEVWVYSRELLFSPAPSPSSGPTLPPSFPLSTSILSFDNPPQATSLAPPSFPYVSVSSSLPLRSLPAYVSFFASYAHHVQARIDFVDQLVRYSSSAVRLLSSINASIAPLAAYATRITQQCERSIRAVDGAYREKDGRWQDALSSLDSELDALADITLPASMTSSLSSAASTLLDCMNQSAVDQAAARARCADARNQKSRLDKRLADLRVRHARLLERVILIRPYHDDDLPLQEAEHQRWIDSWPAQRRQCLASLAEIQAHREEAHAYVGQLNSLLASSSSSSSLSSLEAEARARIVGLEESNRRDRDQRLADVSAKVETYKRDAESLLQWSARSFGWHGQALRIAGDIEREGEGVRGGADLAQEHLRACERAVATVERVVKLRGTWTAALEEAVRRKRRAQSRKKAVEQAVQQWTAEDHAERDRRQSFWKDHGANLQALLPATVTKGWKEEAGWVRVELRNEESQLPPVTEDELREARKSTGAEDSEERKDQPVQSLVLEQAEGHEATLGDHLRRLEEKNRQLAETLASLQSSSLSSPPPSDALVSGSPSRPRSPRSLERLLADSIKNAESVENNLGRVTAELQDERKQAAHLSVMVKRATTNFRKAEQSRQTAEKELSAMRELLLERVALVDIAINDCVMADREGQAKYRVRNLMDKHMFLSSETISAMGQGRGGDWPDWVIGTVVFIDEREVRGKEGQALGLREGEEYWLLTIGLISDAGRRRRDDEDGKDERRLMEVEAKGGGSASSASNALSPSRLRQMDARVLAAP